MAGWPLCSLVSCKHELSGPSTSATRLWSQAAPVVQEGDMATLLKRRNGKLLNESEIMLKFVQICLGLMHVHNKVRPAVLRPLSGLRLC